MFPEAEHVAFDFNLKDGTVTASTDGLDEAGAPLTPIVYSQPVKAENEAIQEPAIEIEATAEPTVETTAEPTTEPTAETTVEPTTQSATDITVEPTPATTETPIREKPEVYDSRVLTIEEQRDIALKVCFFFISIVLASFGILYVYHRMKQQTRGVPADKQSL